MGSARGRRRAADSACSLYSSALQTMMVSKPPPAPGGMRPPPRPTCRRDGGAMPALQSARRRAKVARPTTGRFRPRSERQDEKGCGAPLSTVDPQATMTAATGPLAPARVVQQLSDACRDSRPRAFCRPLWQTVDGGAFSVPGSGAGTGPITPTPARFCMRYRNAARGPTATLVESSPPIRHCLIVALRRITAVSALARSDP